MSGTNTTARKFNSWNSFNVFAQNVRRRKLCALLQSDEQFLQAVSATSEERTVPIPENFPLFRARKGAQYYYDDDNGELRAVHCFGPSDMKPGPEHAQDGRANPKGIPVLYLATTILTAISEVRPWIGEDISVARFKVLRELKAVDLTPGFGKHSIFNLTLDELAGDSEPSEDTVTNAVWTDIDNAFSRPVTREDDLLDYVPTQILAEHFQRIGFEALVYRSHFGESGFNVVLFDTDDAVATAGYLHDVKRILIEAPENERSW